MPASGARVSQKRSFLRGVTYSARDGARRRLIPCLASAVVIPTRKNGGRPEKAACKKFKGALGSTTPHPRTGRTRAGPREKSAAVAAGAGLGPGTEGMRREAVIGSTGEVRQERPSLKEASNASARPEAQHSSQATERRESTLSGHVWTTMAGVVVGFAANACHERIDRDRREPRSHGMSRYGRGDIP